MKHLLFLTIFISIASQADCIIWRMKPTAPNAAGCVGWNIEYVPVSDTNCMPIPPTANPIARFNPAIDPSDCVFRNVAGRSINLCDRVPR